ncbi:ribonuclease H [Opitutia bacterium ISCC 51]|nr:ribonuclease H [Opitutae bacterium ISCC 51]QXD28787.1 ribonuclease H [Opitutae bacterium ISCC 52]
MPEMLLFTDGSVSTQRSVGYGAYLRVTNASLPLEVLQTQIKAKRFEPTSSTRLELQTLLWALNEVRENAESVLIHTDSQNILSLPNRRSRLEKNEFRSKKGSPLKNRELYQEFYQLIDHMDCQFVKVKGHLKRNEKDAIDHILSLVDKASRNALRNEFK